MSRNLRNILIGLVALAVVIAVVVFVYLWVSGGSGEASTDINDVAENTALEGNESSTVFSIVPEQSEVRFILDEDLSGVRTTVTGRTNQVAGDIAVNFDNPSASEVGTITINMRTLATNNEFRNRAIRGQILQSAQAEFEFATFTPTSAEGLPDSVTIGEPFTFTITGDLTIKDITAPVTFNVEVTPVSETTIAGAATAVVLRETYGLQIPSVPNVANVEEEVELEIDFVAQAVEAEEAA